MSRIGAGLCGLDPVLVVFRLRIWQIVVGGEGDGANDLNNFKSRVGHLLELNISSMRKISIINNVGGDKKNTN